MNTVLAIIGGCIAIIVIGAVFYTIWPVLNKRKQHNEVFRSWTVLDYGAISVFVIGLMLLIADLFAVIRDRDSYPYYHYSYLLIATVLVVIGMMFMVVRLGVVFRSSSKAESLLPDDNNKPDKADEADERIEG